MRHAQPSRPYTALRYTVKNGRCVRNHSPASTELRWAASGKGKRGGARIIYVYVVIAARIYLLRCYAKNVRADLTADEKNELRRIAAHLKGVQ
jgi:hypothetical protein